jgi:hypothetical protein
LKRTLIIGPTLIGSLGLGDYANRDQRLRRQTFVECCNLAQHIDECLIGRDSITFGFRVS